MSRQYANVNEIIQLLSFAERYEAMERFMWDKILWCDNAPNNGLKLKPFPADFEFGPDSDPRRGFTRLIQRARDGETYKG